VQIIGAGPSGTLLALLLAQRGLKVRVFEKRADPRNRAPERGRSINLALAARGLRALQAAGAMAAVQALMLPMRGRIVHVPGAAPQLQAYGQAEHEQIYSVSRAELTRVLIETAAAHERIELRFEQCLDSISVPTHTAFFTDRRAGGHYQCSLEPTIAADGAGSAARRSLAAAGELGEREDLLDHAYKELTLPPREGRHALDPGGLHIWPRQDFMLIALPNPDASFTCTLFLAARGATASFEALAADPGAPRRFFAREFPDALALMPDFDAEFATHPTGILGTVHADRWHVGGRVLLLGDAAHAIVPFHGQGLNCGFEDCVALAELWDAGGSWESVFAAFEARRRPQAAAIAAMALENYAEMRAEVTDPDYLAERALARALERAFPGRIIPRYSMVMFHPEIPYASAQQRGAALEDCVRRLRADGLSEQSPVSALAAHAAVRALLASLPPP
jgi:kynurenine 3-monooxygenase